MIKNFILSHLSGCLFHIDSFNVNTNFSNPSNATILRNWKDLTQQVLPFNDEGDPSSAPIFYDGQVQNMPGIYFDGSKFLTNFGDWVPQSNFTFIGIFETSSSILSLYRAPFSIRASVAGLTGFNLYINPMGNFEFWFGKGIGLWTVISGPAAQTNKRYLVILRGKVSSNALRMNGVNYGGDTSAFVPTASNVIVLGAGENVGLPFLGDEYEFAYFNRAINDYEILEVEESLKYKWAIGF